MGNVALAPFFVHLAEFLDRLQFDILTRYFKNALELIMPQHAFTGTYQDFDNFYQRLKQESVAPNTKVKFIVETDDDEQSIMHTSNREWLKAEINQAINELDAKNGREVGKKHFAERRQQLRQQYHSAQK